MTDTRSSSALFKRAEQLKRWEESDTNKQSSLPKRASRIQFSPGIVFLAACTAGDKDEVQRLLKMGADINTANVDGLTALHQACIDDNLDMVEFLVTHGADVNRGDNEGWTPLHATASCGFQSIARYLLESGADVAAVNCDGELPIDIAESDAMEDLLQKVINDKGINCDESRRAEVNSLLSDARNWAANGYIEVRDPKTGGTPLHVAAAKGYLDVAKTLLVECNSDPDCVDYEGWTPLHAAALWGQKEMAQLLLQNGADPHLKNYSGQTCLDLADSSISSWLEEASRNIVPRRVNNNNNNNLNNNINNKRKASPPRHDVKRVELQNMGQTDTVINDKPTIVPEIVTKLAEGKPPKGRPPSPDNTEISENATTSEDAPSWRRTASFRNRQPDIPREPKSPNNNIDNETILRRTRSFENDKTINPTDRRDREVNTWNAPTHTSPNVNTTNTTTQTTVRSSESVESNSSNSTSSATTPTKLSPGNIFKNFFKSFVPPVRDEESETQRKAHAKRVRETRRSTQGVTLDEIKSAEQLVKKKAGNGVTESSSLGNQKNNDDTSVPVNSDNTSFELEDAGRASPRSVAPATATTNATVNTNNATTEAVVTLPLRRAPAASTANTVSSNEKDNREDDDKRESSMESKSSSNASLSSTQAALNVIQRRRRPKRRSTGVGHVDMDDIVNDRGGSGEGEVDGETAQSGSERTEDGEEPDYKALYEASANEVRRLRALLTTSEQQLRDARATITRLTQVNQNSLSELEKREKRAMERKLSEMEEELKQLQKLKAENERLRAENRALTRVVSKLTNSAAK